MQLFQKDDATKSIDHWPSYASGVALVIASLFSWLSSEWALIAGFSLVLGLGIIAIMLAEIRRLDVVILIAFQLFFGSQVAMAIYYDVRLTWVIGGILIAITPSVLWLSTTKWKSQSFGAWAGYLLMGFGFLLSFFSLERIARVSFVFTTYDALIILPIVASILTSLFLRNRIFKKEYILFAISGFSSQLVFVVVLIDFIGSNFEITGHRMGVYTDLGPNLLAFCLDISMPLTLGIALSREKGFIRTFLLINAAFLIVALLLTGTRGSIITIVATLIWMIVYFRKHKYFWLVVPPIGFVVFVVLVEKMIGRLMIKSESEILSTLGRLLLLKTAADILEANKYIWGIGMNQFSIVKFDFGFPLWFNPTKNMSSHNTYFEYWLGWGAASLVGYLTIVARACLNFLRQATPMDVGAAISIIGYSIHGFVDSSVASYPITFTFWLLLGVGISVENKFQNSQK